MNDNNYVYGDTLDLNRDANDGSILCLSLNVNGLKQNHWKAKNDRLRQFLKGYNFDIMGFQETNLNWDQVQPKDQWDERTMGWWEQGQTTIKAHNKQDIISSASQPGGCMITSTNSARRKIVECGVDFRNLGRWAWTRYKGKDQVSTRVISAYRPGTNAGAHTVHSQQRSYFDNIDDERTPRDIMLTELCEAIKAWQEEGDHIILLMDANEHVGNAHLTQVFEDIGLKEAILSQHQDEGFQSTHQRGSDPIDGIFISANLNVEASGYLPFGEGSSDHRGLWIKVKEEDLFGYNMEKVQPASIRRLKLHDPRVVKRWIEAYKAYLNEHDLPNRIYAIQIAIEKGQWNEQRQKEYEDIRLLRRQGIDIADSKCRKLRMGEVPWSMTLQSARDEIELWTAVVSRKRGNKVSTKYISRLEKKTSTPHSCQIHLQQASERLQESYKRYYELKAGAWELRESWLMELAAIKAKELGGNQHKHYNNLILLERQRIANRRMKRIFGKMNGQGITSACVTQEDGTVIEHTTKEDIERACHEENFKKFSQTNNTPAMMGQLADDIGYDGTSDVCQKILEGTYIPPPDTDEYTTAYLKELQRPSHLQEPPIAAMTTPNFQSGWKKINENISSGLSGIHFGHMKACAMDDFLSDFEATVCHIPYATGYSPSDWKTSINTMIPKKGKKPEVENLRTINLMEAEFNFNNKKMGRDVGACAERNKLLPKEQYGSRTGHQARHHGANKKLLYDLAHFQRKPMILCSTDAKSNYDRILHSMASMAMRRLGLPSQPITCMITTIQQMEHYIRTGFGDSDITMSGVDNDVPFQGILQGNGSGPVLWLAVSTPLLEMMRTRGHGIRYRTPLSKENDDFVGFAFVDDTDLVQGNFKSTQIDLAQLFEEAQENINCWEGGMKATGGAIRPDKSFAYPISFVFKPSGEYYFEKVDDMEHTLSVKDHEDVRKDLKLIDAHVGMETLGMFLAPDGNMKDEIKALKKKVSTWCSQIRSGNIPPQDAFQSISTRIMKTLEYPLCATTFTRSECNNLVKPIHDAAFPKAHICRTIPHAIRYGSIDTLGLGLDDLYVTQGIDKVILYMEEINGTSMTTPLLRANLEWAMIHVGIGERNIFDLDFDAFGHLLPPTWIRSLWQFIHEYKIELPSHDFMLKKKRDEDKFLMEAFHTNGFNAQQLQQLNRCRHYLQVETLSDITDGTGNQISKQAYDGRKTTHSLHSHDWPVQERPNAKHWKLWRRALRNSFPRVNNISIGTLQQPLGPWIDGQKDQWLWFYSDVHQQLYFRNTHNNTWKTYKRVCLHGQTHKLNAFQYSTTTRNLPLDAVRATVQYDPRNHNRFRITGWAPENIIHQTTTEEKDEQNMTWMINQVYNTPAENWIIQQLRHGHKLMVVSDGSYHPQYKVGTSAWVITSENDTSQRIYADNIIPGDEYLQCPHRSELGGLIGAIRHITTLCNQHNITDGTVEIACDGMEAYKIASRFEWKHITNMGHYDMASCLHQLLRRSTLQWTFRHVKGHQDDNKATADIDIWGQLNMVADAYAKVALWRKIENDLLTPNMTQISKAIAPLYISYSGTKTMIASNLKKRLSHHIAQQQTIQYWKQHNKPIQDNQFDMEVFTHAARNVPLYQQRWLTKWTCGICGVGKWLERWKEQSHSKCPRCLTDNETVDHVILCQHDSATLCWNTGIEELQEWMRTHNAIPGLAEAVGHRLKQWRNHEPLEDLDFLDESVQTMIQKQDELGWNSILFGSVHKAWSRAQGAHLDALGKKTTGTTWMSQFIRKVWNIQHSMWLHRNSLVHKGGKSLHKHEEEAVERVIREEFIIGRNGLPQDYAGLFRGNVQRIVNADSATKVQWLYRVWSGRDRIRREQDIDPWYKDPLAATFIRRNHIRRKRKRQEDVLDDG